MKYLVETNLLNSTEKDFNSVYTDEVKRGMLAYANGERNATPQTEQNYVLCKFKEFVKAFNFYLNNSFTVILRNTYNSSGRKMLS